jgi:Fe-S-cluster containining protein
MSDDPKPLTTTPEWQGLPADLLPEEEFAGFRALVDEVDAGSAAFVAAYPGEVRCKAGCSECCRSFFEVGLVDGLYLLKGVAALPPAERAAAVERAWAALKAIDATRQETDPHARPSTDFVKDLDLDYARSLSGVYCPLLDAGGGCSIYYWRPMVCRYYGLPRAHPAAPDQLDYCYLNFRGLRAAGSEPVDVPAMDVAGWRRRLDELEGALAERLFGSRALRFSAPIAEYVAAAGRSLGQWDALLAPLRDRVFVAVRRFFEALGARDEARRNVLDPYAVERSQTWADERLAADPVLSAELDGVVSACLDRLAGERVDGLAVARLLALRGPEFRRHALLVALQVARELAERD